MDLFEAINTQRAMRRLKPDLIPEDILRQILEAAIRAPSGGNRQNWRFILIRDRGLVAKVGEIYATGFQRLDESGYLGDSGPGGTKMGRSARYLAEHFDEVPAVIAACLLVGGRSDMLTAGASIYPAVQNILLAARALGVGSTLTTIHRYYNDDLKKLLGVPDDYDVASLIPLGYPLGRFGAGPRRNVDEVVNFDRWDQSPGWQA